jgi:hypothetical protein
MFIGGWMGGSRRILCCPTSILPFVPLLASNEKGRGKNKGAGDVHLKEQHGWLLIDQSCVGQRGKAKGGGCILFTVGNLISCHGTTFQVWSVSKCPLLLTIFQWISLLTVSANSHWEQAKNSQSKIM